jgi:hypothetical protein
MMTNLRRAEEIDRLLLLSLRHWDVERDLIEERMAAICRGEFVRKEAKSVATVAGSACNH